MFPKCITLLLLLYSTTINAKLIIIGSGPSGIAAATRLLEHNVTDFIVLEAENRIGGRINTTKFGANVQDLGAQWCHGESNNVVFKMANPLGLLEHPKVTYEHSVYLNAKGDILPNLDPILSQFDNLYEVDESPSNFSTFGEYFTDRYDKYIAKAFKELDPEVKKGMLHLFHLMTKSLEACDSWTELSMKSQQNYNDHDGDQMMSWKGRGYQTILDVLTKKIPDPTQALPFEEKVLLNKEVININWSHSPVVKCKDGSEYQAERVLFTPSLGVLKANYESLFTPQLPPSKIDAINGLGFGAVDKLIFEFSSPWWDDRFDSFFTILSKLNESPQLQALVQEHDWLKDVGGFHRYDYQPNILMGWLVGESALKMERLEDNVVKSKLMEFMRLFLGKHYNISEPVSFVRTQWGINPHFRGSYSFNNLLTERLNTSNAVLGVPLTNSDNVEVVQFAGEATHPDRYSTVDGAIETGWREADRILKQ